jgi:hypothetical protein
MFDAPPDQPRPQKRAKPAAKLPASDSDQPLLEDAEQQVQKLLRELGLEAELLASEISDEASRSGLPLRVLFGHSCKCCDLASLY